MMFVPINACSSANLRMAPFTRARNAELHVTEGRVTRPYLRKCSNTSLLSQGYVGGLEVRIKVSSSLGIGTIKVWMGWCGMHKILDSGK